EECDDRKDHPHEVREAVDSQEGECVSHEGQVPLRHSAGRRTGEISPREEEDADKGDSTEGDQPRLPGPPFQGKDEGGADQEDQKRRDGRAGHEAPERRNCRMGYHGSYLDTEPEGAPRVQCPEAGEEPQGGSHDNGPAEGRADAGHHGITGPVKCPEDHREASVVPTPMARYHLETKPTMGGRPAMLRAASVNAPNSQGIFLPIPSSSDIFVFPVSTATAPATKNIVSLPSAWAVKAQVAPITANARPASDTPETPDGRKTAAPRIM